MKRNGEKGEEEVNRRRGKKKKRQKKIIISNNMHELCWYVVVERALFEVGLVG